jgi:hypothetical protein
LNYVNRQYVKRPHDKDKGWLRFGDIVSSESPSLQMAPPLRAAAVGPGMIDDGSYCTGSHKRIAEKMRECRAAELHGWGAPEGGMAVQLGLAEACAEVVNTPVHVVPVLSLAYRRFHTEVLEPLLTESLNFQTKINSCFPSVSQMTV